MDKTPDPIQELVAAARRKQILDAATQVFAEKGFHRATVKEIARVAGIADGTIYTYFASKTEVLLGIFHRLNESTEREQQLTPESKQDLRSFFTAYLRQRMALLWPNAEVFQAVLPEMLVNEELRAAVLPTGAGAHLHRRRTHLPGAAWSRTATQHRCVPHGSCHRGHAFWSAHVPIARRRGNCPAVGRTPRSPDLPAL